jgi:F-type H+-transporting ATPase subunit b
MGNWDSETVMPQIAQLGEVWSSQVFWLLVTFGFVFFVIGLGMVPKIQSTVDARDSKISGDLEAAKAAFAKGDEIEETYRARENESRAKAQAVIADAKAKAAKDTEKQIAVADAKIATKVAAAEADIRAASASAMTEIEAVAVEAAQNMVAKISGTSPTPAAAEQAVKAALAHG